MERGKREGGHIWGALLGVGVGAVGDDKLDREGKGEENSGEDPKVPAWRVGHSTAAEYGRERVYVGCSFAQPSRLPAGLQLNITIMARSSLEWPTGGNSQEHSRQPRGSGAAPECFPKLAGVGWWFSTSQLNLPCSWTQNLAFVLVPELFSLALISPFKQAEDSTKSTFKCEVDLEQSQTPSLKYLVCF